MARAAPALSSFTAGEISPRLEGRVTLEKYREGLSDLTNMVVHPHGGVTRRPGTEFLGEVKFSNTYTRLIPFQFKTSDTYILEFGQEYMRVYRNGLQVLVGSPKTITAITQASPGVLTSNSHGLSDGEEIYIDSVGGMVELNNRNFKVANATTNTFTLQDLFGNDIDTTGYTAFTSGGEADKIYEIATPYTAANLPTLNFAQSADVMYLVHPSYEIRT
ncbi:MAG: ubiquitin-activating E1 FCCH domain-containing protein, partial [Candidatus Nanopelagicales bacterium]